MQLPEFDWILIQELLYKVYKAENPQQMRETFLQHLRLLLNFDRAYFYLSTDGELQHGDVVTAGFAPHEFSQYNQHYNKQSHSSWVALCTESRAYRSSDFFTEAQWQSNPSFLQEEQQYNVRYSVRLPLLHNEQLMGLLTLLRRRSSGDFSDRDLFVLETTKKHLALALYKSLVQPPPTASCVLAQLAAQHGLTPRETEVLALLASGERNDEIARQLCITPNTEKKHLLNIYKKLCISSRSDLIRLLQ